MDKTAQQQADQSAGGRDFLYNLALSTDRRLLLDLLLQLLLAGGAGWLAGWLLEGSGWLVDGSGAPLGGALALGLGLGLPVLWGFVIGQLMPYWRDAFQLFLIPELRRTYLLYAVLEHQPHDRAIGPLNLTPPASTPGEARRISLFGVRISALAWALPAVMRRLGYSDYPARWGGWAYGAFLAGATLTLLALFVPSVAFKSHFSFSAFILLGGWLAFQQARLQAAQYCLSAAFISAQED